MHFLVWYYHLTVLYLSIKKPRPPPIIRVITDIGIIEIGSFHAIRMAEGSNIMNEIRIPFRIGFNLKSIDEMIIPMTTHIENAEIFASHVNF